MSRRVSVKAAAVLLAVPLALSACGSDNAASEESTTAATTSTAASQTGADPFTAEPGSVVDTGTFIEATKKAMQDKGTYAITADMSASGQPMNLSGSVNASDPADPKMSLKMSLAGQSLDFMIVDKTAYMQLPGVTGDKYIKMSLAELYAAGGGTANFEEMLNPQRQLEASKEAIESITYIGEETVDNEKLRHYDVKIDTAKALQAAGQTSVPSDAASSLPTAMTYAYYLDSDKLMRQAKINDSTMNMTIKLSDFGKPVTITAPAASQVTTMPTAPGSTTK